MSEESRTNDKGAPEAILVATDFSDASLRALETALSWRREGAEITLLSVVDTDLVQAIRDSGLTVAEDPAEGLADDANRRLSRLIAERGLQNVQAMVVHGQPFVEIVKVANDLDLDLIILGRSGHSDVEHILFGGTAEKVLRAATRPVLCIP